MEKTEHSSTKRQKLISGENTDLSALPDHIICHILSFLPSTKLSVSTSILAKRWRYMWAHVPTLSFRNYDHRKGRTTGFSNIIYKVLLLHKLQHIDSFSMNFSYTLPFCCCIKKDFDAWITTLIARNIQKLHLYISRPDYELKLPRCLFTCKTLVDLSLDTGGHNTTIILMMTWTPVVCLPALKKLRLHGVDYESDETLLHMLSGCPVLEELSIFRLEDNMSAFSDFTTKFQNLTKLCLDADWCFITKFLENADNLQELQITTCRPESNDVLKCWMEPKQVPACMVSHLRIVKIEEFGSIDEEEENMIRYIMRNALVLKRMVIESIHNGIDLNIDLKEKYEVFERISLFERGSKACELTFYQL